MGSRVLSVDGVELNSATCIMQSHVIVSGTLESGASKVGSSLEVSTTRGLDGVEDNTLPDESIPISGVALAV